jgi:hypothetical protein
MDKKLRLIRAIVLVSILLWNTVLKAQTKPVAADTSTLYSGFLYNEDLFAFADLRYGYSMIGHHFHAGGSFKYRFNQFKIGFTHSSNFSDIDTQQIRLNELGLLYGWNFRKRNFLFNVAFGVSGNWGIVTTNKKGFDSLPVQIDPLVNARAIGFPMEINFSFTPPPKLRIFSSIGISFFGNFNSKKSYFGGGLNLSLGKVSPKLPPGAESDKSREYYMPKPQRQRWYD